MSPEDRAKAPVVASRPRLDGETCFLEVFPKEGYILQNVTIIIRETSKMACVIQKCFLGCGLRVAEEVLTRPLAISLEFAKGRQAYCKPKPKPYPKP